MAVGLVIAGCGRIDYDPLGECDAIPDGMLAAYSFDGPPADVTDRVGGHDGRILGAAGALRSVSSSSECGAAISFGVDDTGAAAWVELPDSPDWDLRRGSVDLWVRPPASGGFAAILTRDADGTARAGHLALFIEPDGTLWLRLQTTTATAFRCAEGPIAPGEWGHVGINFGPPDLELWLDGALQDRATPLTSASGTDVRCGELRSNAGIDGNDNPWILGGGSQRGPEGAGMPVTDLFTGGAIDELRIAPFPRAF